jgi:hypothetical protein
MADDERMDDATKRQREAGARRGERIPGKGFDPGTGYGGAGNDNAYDAENSYGGQSGVGGDQMRGAYAGEPYGRPGDREAPPDSLDADTGAEDDDVDFDPTAPLGGERREPGR